MPWKMRSQPGLTLTLYVFVALLGVLDASAARAQTVPAPACFVGFVGDLRASISDPDLADEFFIEIHSYGPTALEGSAKTLQYVGGVKFHEMFKTLEDLRKSGRHPFRSDEELFEVVGRLSEEGVEDTHQVVGSLGGGFLNAQGATFDLYIAREIAGGTDYSRIRRFQESHPVGNTTRKYDIVDSAGVRHENKNWSQGVPVESSDQFMRFMREFQADIVLDGRSGFTATHYNFHVSAESGLPDLKKKLLAQFESDLVKQNLDADGIDFARSEFERLWDNKQLFSLHSYS